QVLGQEAVCQCRTPLRIAVMRADFTFNDSMCEAVVGECTLPHQQGIVTQVSSNMRISRGRARVGQHVTTTKRTFTREATIDATTSTKCIRVISSMISSSRRRRRRGERGGRGGGSHDGC